MRARKENIMAGKLNELFKKKIQIVNFGIQSFYNDNKKQNIPSVHVDWKPVAGGNQELANLLDDLL